VTIRVQVGGINTVRIRASGNLICCTAEMRFTRSERKYQLATNRSLSMPGARWL